MNSLSYYFRLFYERYLKHPDIIIRLIVINVLVFIIIGLIKLGYFIFGGVSGYNIYNTSFVKIWNNLSLSAIPSEVIRKPWTLITYMFMHSGIFHIFWNMLIFYWFGRILREFQGDNKIWTLYILGGIAGGLLYLLAYATIPVLKNFIPGLGLVGASASVLAILVAAAVLVPDYTIYLLFFGAVRIKYIAIVLILIDLITLPEGNYGGHIAHLGGALFGFLTIYQLKRGRDITLWLERFVIALGEAFKQKPRGKSRPRRVKFKTVKNKSSQRKYKETENQELIDKILDKIARSGYDSLSDAEKEILFKASKKKDF